MPFVSVQSSPGGGKTFLLNLLAESVLQDQGVLEAKKVFPVLITFNDETPISSTEDPVAGLCLRLVCR